MASNPNKRDRYKDKSTPWRDRETLERLWVVEERTTQEIADELGCTGPTIHRWVDKFGFERRQENNGPWDDEETLREMYVKKGMRAADIGDKFGVSASTIYRGLRRHDISARGRKRDDYPRIYTDNPAYEYILMPDCKIGVHRLLAVAEWGFDAVTEKHVHHKNRVQWDNRPSNIELVTESEHMEKHQQELQEDGVHSLKVDKELCQTLRQEYGGDVTLEQLGDKYGIDVATVWYHIQEKCSR